MLQPGELHRSHRYHKLLAREETPCQDLVAILCHGQVDTRGHGPVHVLHQGWVCMLDPQPEGQEASCSCCLLFEEWLGGQENGPRGGNGTGSRGGQPGGTEEGGAREDQGVLEGLAWGKEASGGQGRCGERWSEGPGRTGADLGGL